MTMYGTSNAEQHDSPRAASPSYVCALASDLLLRAQKELHEKPEWRERDIDGLRLLVDEVKDLRADMSDAFLIRFLRACKFDYDNAFNLLMNYYIVHSRFIGLFDCTPNSLLYILQSNCFAITNQCDYRGARVVVVNLTNWSPVVYSADELLQCVLLLCEHLANQESVQVTGVTFVVDVRGQSIGTVWKRDIAKKLIACTQNALPLRMKAIHVLHDSYIWNPVMTVMKSLFVSDKIRQRLHFHDSPTSLQQYLDTDILSDALCAIPSQQYISIATTRASRLGSTDYLIENTAATSLDSPRLHSADIPVSSNSTASESPMHSTTTTTHPAQQTVQALLTAQPYFERQRQFGFVGSRLYETSSTSGSTHNITMTPRVAVVENKPAGCHLLFSQYKKFCIDSLNN